MLGNRGARPHTEQSKNASMLSPMMPTSTATRLRVVLISTALVIAMLVTAIPVASATTDEFRFEGTGWGHGVGMSQFGAQARALAGQTADEIVTAYYAGASVTETPAFPEWFTTDEKPLWVGLLQNRERFDFTPDAGTLGLCQGLGACPNPDLGAPVPGESWSFRSTGPGTCQFFNGETPMGGEDNCFGRIILGVDTETRITLTDSGHTFARGEITVRPTTSTEFHVIVEISMEDYLLGIREVPLSWEPAALQAQVLAARSFAAYRAFAHGSEPFFSSAVKARCWCHVMDEAVDQVYRGWEVENHPTHGINWVNAVQATAGRYITHPDTRFTRFGVILAVYSSSNGGASEVNTVGFGSRTQYPYLVSVPDPWSLIGNPNAPWPNQGTRVPAVTVAARLLNSEGLPELTQVDRIRVIDHNLSGSAKTVLFEGKNGVVNASTTRDGRWTRGNLGLRSTWISQVCRERGPYSDDDCSFFEHNIGNIHAAGFVGVLPGNTYLPDNEMTRSDMASFLALGLSLPESQTDFFPDDDADPNHGAINALAHAGIVIGYEDGTYRPGNSVTRAEMAVFLTRALQVTLPYTVPDPFPDVPGASWFGPAVAEILDRGVTTGHDDGTFRPSEHTTRGQMAAFLDRALLGGF